jgi:hypothetical protein
MRHLNWRYDRLGSAANFCINTDRKFWALGFVAMCQEET